MNINNNLFHQVQLRKHLGLFLDPKLSFEEHIQCILIKTWKIIGLIRKLEPIIPREALLTIGDILYDRPFNESSQKSVQYNVALAITGAIRGLSRIRS